MKTARKIFEDKYPKHTRILKEWAIILMEEYANQFKVPDNRDAVIEQLKILNNLVEDELRLIPTSVRAEYLNHSLMDDIIKVKVELISLQLRAEQGAEETIV